MTTWPASEALVDYRLAEAAIVLARYDRQVADVFVTQAMSSLSRQPPVYYPMVIRAKAGVDPQGAVAMIEALPPGSLGSAADPANVLLNQARHELINFLVEPSENHWKVVWRSLGHPARRTKLDS